MSALLVRCPVISWFLRKEVVVRHLAIDGGVVFRVATTMIVITTSLDVAASPDVASFCEVMTFPSSTKHRLIYKAIRTDDGRMDALRDVRTTTLITATK